MPQLKLQCTTKQKFYCFNYIYYRTEIHEFFISQATQLSVSNIINKILSKHYYTVAKRGINNCVWNVLT